MRTDLGVALGGLLLAVSLAAGCARRDRSIVYAQPGRVPAGGGHAMPAGEARGGGYAQPVCVQPSAAARCFTLKAALEMRAGSPRGHIQIPKGGQPGTTSLGRPTL